MPSHSLRLCWCNSDRGHKGSARPRVQLRPKAAAKPENGADFCSGIFGNGGGFFRKRGGFFRKRGGFLGGKLPKQRAEKINGQLGGFYLFARRKFEEENFYV